jgi:hypothetical protein
VPKVAKAVVPTAIPQACAPRDRAAELPMPSTAAITSSGIAALLKPVAKWTAEASANVAASAAISSPVPGWVRGAGSAPPPAVSKSWLLLVGLVWRLMYRRRAAKAPAVSASEA